MSELNVYKTAYDREKKARLLAEKLLEDKTRELYDNVLDLQGAVLELKMTQDQLIHSEKMASLMKLIILSLIRTVISFAYLRISRKFLNSTKLYKHMPQIKKVLKV